MTTTVASVEPEGPRDEHDLGQQIVEVMLEIHEDYADAQSRSGSKHQRVYGQIFADLPDRLRAGLLARRDDVDLRKVGHAGYQVPVIDGALYFPWRPPGGAKPEDVQFGGSTTREGLWRVRRESDALPLFDDRDDDLVLDRPADADDTDRLAALLAAAGEHLRVVIVAMTSSSHQVDRIEWGSATLTADGMLVWEPELLWDGSTRPAPASTDAPSFDSGEAPRPTVSPKVRPKEEGGTAAGPASDA
jgi:hypothetical protein